MQSKSPLSAKVMQKPVARGELTGATVPDMPPEILNLARILARIAFEDFVTEELARRQPSENENSPCEAKIPKGEKE